MDVFVLDIVIKKMLLNLMIWSWRFIGSYEHPKPRWVVSSDAGLIDVTDRLYWYIALDGQWTCKGVLEFVKALRISKGDVYLARYEYVGDTECNMSFINLDGEMDICSGTRLDWGLLPSYV